MENQSRSFFARRFAAALGALSLLVASCVSTPTPKPEHDAVFYPEPPELPRIQFLKSFSGSADITPPKSAFDTFVTGQNLDRKLNKPYGVAMYDGKIYVCDSNATVMVFDLKNRRFHRLEGAKGLGKLVQPLNITIEADGTKYVTDPVRGQVIAYNRQDIYLRSYGEPVGWKPVDAVAFDDRLYVVDTKNQEIRIFDKASGAFIKSIGQEGEAGERLGLPTNIAVDAEGTLYVSDAGRFEVVMYDRDGHYLGKIGGPGQNPGYFARPRGIGVDRSGRLYAVDAAFDNVQIFETSGQLLMPFGAAGTDPGDLFLPAEAAVVYDGIEYFRGEIDPNFEVEYLVIVTSQFGDRLVNVYGFGKERGRRYPTREELLERNRKRLERLLEKQGEESGQQDGK